MNWIRLLIRAAATFVVIFLMGYIIPGLSGFTYTHLLIASLLVALAACVADMLIRPKSTRQRSLILFVSSAAVLYLYSLIAMDIRMPLVSTILVAAVISVIDLVYPERIAEERGEEAA